MTISSVGNTAATNPTSTPTSPTTATSGSTANSSSSSAAAGISSNFSTFLQLLTTQLQNQDPTSPLDTNQFTQELVSFSSVEQQINMNSNLSTLISLQQTAQSTSALGFLGTNVTVSSNTAQVGSGQPNPSWNYSLTAPSSVVISVANSTGQVVYSTSQSLGAGNQTFSWNGTNSLGNTVPAGSYTVAITATAANGTSTNVQPQVSGVVSGVDVSANPPTLTVNGQAYTPSQIVQATSGSS
jgi:flagellar basal-body rod modification protein FlgD